MKYERPSVITLKSALDMITTVLLEKAHVVPERDPTHCCSAGAYDADDKTAKA
jgi:hypothetical protein